MKPGFLGGNVDRFILNLQKDTQFKIVNNEIVYPVTKTQDPEK